MTEKEGTNALENILNELLRSKGVELPSIPESAERTAYLNFLSDRGYSEDELLPVIQKDKVPPEAHAALLAALLKAVASDDKEFVKAVVWMAHNTIVGRDNTNLIIHGLATSLVQRLNQASVQAPTFYAGVFPTDSYNAQCCIVEGHNLVLLDTGCMEMAEAVVISFLSKELTETKVSEISSAVERYVSAGLRANSLLSETTGVDFGSGIVPMLVNAFEEFMIAHEIGHLTLGHIESAQLRCQFPRIGESLNVVNKSQLQEFQADMWACDALIEGARKRKRSEADVAIAVGGVTLGLGVALLVEAAATKQGLSIGGSHPPAFERLYMMEVAYELFGAHEDAYIARRFRELLEEVVKECYPETELPPMLARNLNRKLVEVLDSLNIDYSHAPYIRDFA